MVVALRRTHVRRLVKVVAAPAWTSAPGLAVYRSPVRAVPAAAARVRAGVGVDWRERAASAERTLVSMAVLSK